jgi:hypothetical protein
MRLCFLSILFLVASNLKAQDLSKFIGHWEGELQWFQTGKKEPQKVKMQLIIQPADTLSQYTWQIIYGDRGEDNRPYLLKPVDTSKGHWLIDERNGINIDQYSTANRLTSMFTVQNSTILDSYWIEGDKLIAEFYSTGAKPVSATGAGTEDSPTVNSYAVKSYQKAVLKRKTK